jgi:hypothetical protein
MVTHDREQERFNYLHPGVSGNGILEKNQPTKITIHYTRVVSRGSNKK